MYSVCYRLQDVTYTRYFETWAKAIAFRNRVRAIWVSDILRS